MHGESIGSSLGQSWFGAQDKKPSALTTCRTASGDVLDTICQNYYCHLKGTLEVVLDASQDLAQELQPFRAGVVIDLPDLVVPSDEGVKQWG